MSFAFDISLTGFGKGFISLNTDIAEVGDEVYIDGGRT